VIGVNHRSSIVNHQFQGLTMFDLPAVEAIVLALAMFAYAAAGVIAVLQLLRKNRQYGSLLLPLIAAAIVLEVLLLVLRGASIRAVPLTGLFDSLIVLALVFGVLYLFLRSTVEQVWFGSVMVWVILGIVLMAALVARPASRPRDVAATPWAVAHGSAMILATAAVVFAAANSALYLLGSYRLKHKGIMQVLGRIPNMETLTRMNRIGVRVGFVLLTLGVISGLGLASLVGPGIARWLADGKVICIIGAWGLLGAILVLGRFNLLKVKARAYVTILALGLLLVAIIGVTVAGATQHKFSQGCLSAAAPTV
jgi:ABC-type transport system involved in cytochrome c biogenesis permease subunit